MRTNYLRADSLAQEWLNYRRAGGQLSCSEFRLQYRSKLLRGKNPRCAQNPNPLAETPEAGSVATPTTGIAPANTPPTTGTTAAPRPATSTPAIAATPQNAGSPVQSPEWWQGWRCQTLRLAVRWFLRNLVHRVFWRSLPADRQTAHPTHTSRVDSSADSKPVAKGVQP